MAFPVVTRALRNGPLGKAASESPFVVDRGREPLNCGFLLLELGWNSPTCILRYRAGLNLLWSLFALGIVASVSHLRTDQHEHASPEVSEGERRNLETLLASAGVQGSIGPSIPKSSSGNLTILETILCFNRTSRELQ